MCNCTSEVRAGARPGMTSADVCQRLLQMPGKEREAAGPGDIGAGLVITRPFIAVKAVLRARIDVDLDLRPLGPDSLNVAERDACVLFPEMKLGRHVRLVIGEANDGAAVIADCRRQG